MTHRDTPRFADLRDGGNIPRQKRARLDIGLIAILLLIFGALLVTPVVHHTLTFGVTP